MNQFLKIFLASLLAIVVSGVVLIFFLFGLIGAMSVLMEPATTTIQKGSVLKIVLGAPITDKPAPITFNDLSSFNFAEAPTLLQVTEAIGRAKEDPNIKGIYLNLSPMMSTGMANLDEVRSALIDFKSSGKFIVSYTDLYSQSSYYLASVADKIFVNPLGGMMWQGMASSTLFFKGTLDKLGVEPEIIRHGKYKSAIEPFTATTMSPENRAQTTAFVGSIWNYVVGNVARSRGVDSTLLQNYASELAVKDAQSAVALRLADSVGYSDNAVEYIKHLTELDTDPKFVSLKEYVNTKTTTKTSLSKNKIALIYAEGELVDGKGDGSTVGSETLAAYIEAARKDNKVKAIVLRVNSPGGSALAGEVIWRAAALAQKEKPFVVSMGNYAASGGYYISCPADVILANPTTITGSIGVFGMLFNVQRAMNDKLGITMESVKTNPSADIQSALLFQPLTTSQRDYIQHSVEQIYTTFIGHVAAGRNLSVPQVDSIAQGRVWSGVDAEQIGLVDGFGGLKQAILIAADRADVASDYRVESYPKAESRVEQLVTLLGGEVKLKLSGGKSARIYSQYEQFIKSIATANMIQAITPYQVEL